MTRGIGANRRTATMVGGGAALGTLLGAIAGGGKGAAIGAVAGAVAGGAAQVLTRGKEVNVPAETELDVPARPAVAAPGGAVIGSEIEETRSNYVCSE